eukprot:s357_g17.t1
MYLFAGHQRHSDVGSFLRKAAKTQNFELVLMEFDIERSPDHVLTDDALWEKIYSLLKEGGWVLIVSPPCNTFSRARFRFQQHPGPKPLRTRTWPKGFPWLSKRDREKVEEANLFVERCLKGCEISAGAGGHFLLEHPEDLGAVQGEQPGSIWQWDELLELIPKLAATCFAIHQCAFGAITPKPTRFLTDMHVSDNRCFKALPKFDADGLYQGPLPRDCGHVHTHKLIGKTAAKWNTAPSASYPAGLCEFIANLIISSGGGWNDGVCTLEGSVLPPPLKKQRTVERAVEPLPAAPSGAREMKQVVVCDSSGEEVEEVKTDNSTAETMTVEESEQQFDMAACLNAGRPIRVEWDNVQRDFVDGFGLCSPCRWKPSQRGTRRTQDMLELGNRTFQLLADCVMETIVDVRREAFKLVTGKLTESPFSPECLAKVRAKWFTLLQDPLDAAILDDGQPFFLRALSQWLKRFEDPDVRWLVDEGDSFATGVCLGVTKPLPRSPQVFPPKLKHRKLDSTDFVPIADNYSSAQMSVKELEEKFREEEALGRMHPSKLGVLKQQYGDSLRVASMAAIAKPDESVRPLHDATHSVMVNHSIVYQDKIDCPGPAEISSIVRETTETKEAPFCVSADIKAAHRLVKIRQSDWGYMCCRADSSSEVVWVNHTGTFGVSSAPYWCAKIAGLLGRFVGFLFHQRWMMQMIYVDDLHGAFVGPEKFLHVWVWLLAYELAGTPFGYHKFKGGFSSEFVGFHIRYDLAEVGITVKRGDWLLTWIAKAKENRFVVQAREFAEFLGRLGFISQLLVWLKPHLSPLFAWAAVTARGTVGRLPDTVVLTLSYMAAELERETFMVSTRRMISTTGEQFRTDAKCAQAFIVLAGWELSSKRWFSLRLTPDDIPCFFKGDGSSQWASTAAELMATYFALQLFGWLAPGKDRKSVEVSLLAGTDNQANEALSSKRATTKWPLMAVNMQLSSALARARLALRAVEAGHPRDLMAQVSDMFKEAILSNFHRPPHLLAKERVDFIKKYTGMAAELKADELRLRLSMPKHVATLMRNKRLVLWGRMLKDLQYPDVDLIQHIASGFPLSGWMPSSHVFLEQVRQPVLTAEALLEGLSEFNEKVMQQMMHRQEAELERETWDETVKELEKGWVWEDPDQSWAGKCVARRFGIHQGDKTRVIDDCSVCGLNKTVGLREKFPLQAVDQMCAILCWSLRQAGESGHCPIIGRTFDLRSAFKQFGLCTFDRDLLRIAVRDPARSDPVLVGLNALPFGGVGSVAGFLRVSMATWFTGLAGLKVCWTGYFGDFSAVSCKELQNSTTWAVDALFGLIGLDYAKEGAKAPEFSQTFKMLGVQINTTGAEEGFITVGHTEDRRRELAGAFDSAIANNKLSSKTAESLRGRMVFYECFSAGRTTNLLLKDFGKLCREGRAVDDLSTEGCDNILAWRDRVRNAQPIVVSPKFMNTWYFFTDGACESESDGKKVGGVGGVLISACGTYMQHFGMTVPQKVMDIFLKHSKHPVHELEVLPVLISFLVWADFLKHAQVLHYTDNDSCRYALMKGVGETPVARHLVSAILAQESALQTKSWYGRVPSYSNPADDPSRGSFTELLEKGSREVAIPWGELLSCFPFPLGEIDGGNSA